MLFRSQKYLKRYYNLKIFKRPDLKGGNKVWLLYKNILSRQLSKKLNYIKYTKLNIYSFCDVRTILNTKCIFLIRLSGF